MSAPDREDAERAREIAERWIRMRAHTEYLSQEERALVCRELLRSHAEGERLREALRDQFAMAALTGVIWDVRRDRDEIMPWTGLEEDDSDNAELIAAQCYAVADAMLRARSALESKPVRRDE